MEDVLLVCVTTTPQRVTEQQEIVQNIVRIIPLDLTANFVNQNSLVTQPHKIVKVSVCGHVNSRMIFLTD